MVRVAILTQSILIRSPGALRPHFLPVFLPFLLLDLLQDHAYLGVFQVRILGVLLQKPTLGHIGIRKVLIFIHFRDNVHLFGLEVLVVFWLSLPCFFFIFSIPCI
jgi:hypothetical protein